MRGGAALEGNPSATPSFCPDVWFSWVWPTRVWQKERRAVPRRVNAAIPLQTPMRGLAIVSGESVSSPRGLAGHHATPTSEDRPRLSDGTVRRTRSPSSPRVISVAGRLRPMTSNRFLPWGSPRGLLVRHHSSLCLGWDLRKWSSHPSSTCLFDAFVAPRVAAGGWEGNSPGRPPRRHRRHETSADHDEPDGPLAGGGELVKPGDHRDSARAP